LAALWPAGGRDVFATVTWSTRSIWLHLPRHSARSYASLGPGIRASICNNIDFGAAAKFPLIEPNTGSLMLRAELRILS
jgi:hypothetical protein